MRNQDEHHVRTSGLKSLQGCTWEIIEEPDEYNIIIVSRFLTIAHVAKWCCNDGRQFALLAHLDLPAIHLNYFGSSWIYWGDSRMEYFYPPQVWVSDIDAPETRTTKDAWVRLEEINGRGHGNDDVRPMPMPSLLEQLTNHWMPYCNSKRDQLIMCAIKWVLAPLNVETLLSLRNRIPAQRYLRNEGVAQMDGNCGR